MLLKVYCNGVVFIFVHVACPLVSIYFIVTVFSSYIIILYVILYIKLNNYVLYYTFEMNLAVFCSNLLFCGSRFDDRTACRARTHITTPITSSNVPDS